jgi:hypothetical protein
MKEVSAEGLVAAKHLRGDLYEVKAEGPARSFRELELPHEEWFLGRRRGDRRARTRTGAEAQEQEGHTADRQRRIRAVYTGRSRCAMPW